jgi:hypothetical protein
LAVEQRCGVEAAGERLMQAVRQLDEHNTTGRLRRAFENEAPSVTLTHVAGPAPCTACVASVLM